MPLWFLFSCIPQTSVVEADIPIRDYAAGRFDPSTNGYFVDIRTLGIPAQGRQMLRREAAEALKRMRDDLAKDMPFMPFIVLSATRTFDDQKRIWDNKFNGRTRVGGLDLSKAVPDERERAFRILEFSSMPGTSRHHWGTDVDINALNNDYFRSGKGKRLHVWLVKHAARYGFCQPYSAGRAAGYAEERWHWSYMPIAGKMQKCWNDAYGRTPSLLLKQTSFAGAEASIDRAPFYVNAVAQCPSVPAR